MARFAVAVLALATLAVLAGCGGSDEVDPEAKRAAALRAARTAKLERLREELAEKRAQARRQRQREERRQRRAGPGEEAGAVAVRGDFEGLAATLPGTIGASIGGPGSGSADSFGALSGGPAWSTIKVPIALGVLKEVGGPAGLRPAQADQMHAALTYSDNAAAASLYGDLEAAAGGLAGAAGAVTAVLREGGNTTTTTSTVGRGEFSTYGQTEWSLADQQRFVGSLAAGCVADAESSAYVLGLMGEAGDEWGLGAATAPARWKGGWGPGVDGRYLVRQMGLIETGEGEVAVALAAIADDGTFETAQEMATSVADWLAVQAPAYAAPAVGCG